MNVSPGLQYAPLNILKNTMTAISFSSDDVARFLRENPDFLTEHAGTFADLRVPHPHQAHAISLGERQILTLRARARDLEWQLSGLIQNATGNERISKLLIDWCAGLLAETDPHRLPELIIQGLSRLFELPDVALRLWDLSDSIAGSEFAQDISPAIQQSAHDLDKPYCGPANGHDVTSWLTDTPESLAMLPLKVGSPSRTIGLLILGSPDAARFTDDMGTEFLQTIATLASASLSRMADPVQPDCA